MMVFHIQIIANEYNGKSNYIYLSLSSSIYFLVFTDRKRLSTKMAEYVANAAADFVADQAKEYASPYFGYIFRYGEIVEDFENQREALELKKERVKISVDEAERQNELIHKDVDNWLTSAEKELKETQNLKDEIDGVKRSKWYRKLSWRCSLSKKLAEKIPIISKLLETSNFPQVGYRRPLQGIEFITSTDFMDSESSKSAFNQIMEAINAKGVNMIGLHGMPGVGKTTLAKEVGKHAREQKLFDKVVMFTMSQNPNIRTIQDKVAEMFGLKFHTNTEETRAEELFWSMKGVNKILVIVDDLWEEFKMESIGIPFGDDHEGCKILLTTRRQQVCTKMNCKEIQLRILSEDEAWVLFRDKAGLENDCSTLNDVAKEVAAQCKGLPLAIVVVAKALKGESLNEWRDANQRFKDSTHLYDEEVLGGVLEPLKLSYDYLKKGNNQMTGINDIQMCFLLCSLFPEDEEIDTEILIMCGIGVGLFPNFYSIEDKRKKIVEALKKLQKSGLLLESGDAKSIRIHDVIRDFAHWLTSRGENRFMVKDTLEEWPHMDESYTAIALWNCSSIIKKFPDKMEFSKLKTLILGGERKWNSDDFLVVFGTFFEEMKALQVLLLQRVSFSRKGFPSLPNLKTLWCQDCMLKNFSSSLTNMRSLEILALIGTEIDEISEELVKLSALKYLRLSSEKFEEFEEFEEFKEFKMNIPPNLVSRLTSLQELHVISANNLNLLELKSLSRLTALSLELSANQIPLEDFVLPKLQRYGVVVGEIYAVNREAFIRTLYIQDFSSSLSAFNNLFCNVEALDLFNVGGQKNIVPSIDEMGVNELTSLSLASCNDMEFLIDTINDQGSTVAFSNLVKLNVFKMASLKGLCNGVSPTRFLQNLKQVSIEDCKELQVIFQIDKLSERMKYQTPLLSNLTMLELSSLPKLESIWEVKPSHRAIASLQSLKVVRIESCHNLKTIFSPCLALSKLHLQKLDISYCDRLEQVIGFGQEGEIIENDCLLYCWPKLEVLRIKDCESLKYISSNTLIQSLESVYIYNCHQLIQIYNMEQSIVLPELGSQESLTNLKDVNIGGCENLKYLCSSQGLPYLESIEIEDCPRLIQIFNMEKNKDGFGLQGFPLLESIYLSNCPQLLHVFKNDSSLCCWPKLRSLRLQNCRNLKYVCATTWTQGLQSLESVFITECSQLIQVFNMEQNKHGQDIVLPELGSQEFLTNLNLRSLPELKYMWNGPNHYLNLHRVQIIDCDKLTYLFSEFTARTLVHLQFLEIRNCYSLEHLIGEAENMDEINISNTKDQSPLFLPNLKGVRIAKCENLKYLCSSQALPYLESIEIEDCPRLIQIFNMEKNKDGFGLQNDSPLCCWPKLRILHIEFCPKLKYVCANTWTRGLQSLELVYIKDCSQLIQVFNMEQNKHGQDIVLPELGSQNDSPLCCWPKLRILHIEFCPKLKYVCANTWTRGLQSLESVFIRDCSQLIQVFNMEQNKHGQDIVLPELGSQNHCWTKLKTLQIEDCQLLKYVFANTLSQGFPLLESLYLKNCPQLLQVFSSTEERDVIGDHILLNVPFLKNLEVSNCPQISCFIVQAQRIEELVLSNVGNSRQLCNTDVPVLNEGCIVVGNHEEVFQVQGGYSFSSIKKLKLRNLFEARVIWNDFAQVVNLENLTTLTLSDCKKLRYIFSPMMARSLSHLKDLSIEGCEEIELLILDKDQVSSSSSNGDTSHQPMSFRNLTWITVTNCKNLNSLFPFGFVPVLPMLESLIVKRNSKLEQVFELEEKVEVVAEEKMKFDNLKGLLLEELPGLIQFCPKGYHFVFPKMMQLKVRDCPKLTTGFFIDSQRFVHCKTKLVEQDAVEESTTIRNAIFNENIYWSLFWGEGQLPHIA
ncbi:hypothetical protein [Gossypium barbadense]|uniref:Uncharacterized protein n=1 Tax=Gossypium barbadense TaxID=3634 RepID=A0A5J5NEH5_GOSBA|nr:hypothetical protein [Gossypium barbadense]